MEFVIGLIFCGVIAIGAIILKLKAKKDKTTPNINNNYYNY